jgi:hypothetical protein
MCPPNGNIVNRRDFRLTFTFYSQKDDDWSAIDDHPALKIQVGLDEYALRAGAHSTFDCAGKYV